MADFFTNPSPHPKGVPLPPRIVSRIPVFALAMSLGAFLDITYILCIVFDLWLPQFAMNPIWVPLLPGFTWLTWPSFFLGLAELFAYGWYGALVFGSLYNYFIKRFQ